MTLPLAKFDADEPLTPAIRIRDLYKRFGQPPPWTACRSTLLTANSS